jgi:hypothetical protein
VPAQSARRHGSRLRTLVQASLRDATADQPERGLVGRGLLASYGVSDVASTVFRDRFGCWGFLDLWRIDPEARFGDAEVEFLSRIAPAVTEALRRAQARSFESSTAGPARTGPVVLVLSPELQVREQTATMWSSRSR